MSKRVGSQESAPSDQPTTAGSYHVPALLEETVDVLITDPDGIYVDATFGGGGHSREILRRLGPEGHLFGLDRDLDAQERCGITDPRFTFVRTDFRYLTNFLSYFGITQVDGLLADLGVSSHDFDEAERGFSFRYEDAPIDMRMNRAAGETAAELIERLERDDLAALLQRYGEVRQSRRAATLIKEASEGGRLTTMKGLVDALAPMVPEYNRKLRNKLLSQVFQALRITVNDEMGSLYALLRSLPELLRPGGRAVFITYHSLEDRPVKNFFRTGDLEGERDTDLYGNVLSPLRPLSSKPIVPSPEEIECNPRVRSAKLRAAERIR